MRYFSCAFIFSLVLSTSGANAAVAFVADGGYNNGTTSAVLTKPAGTANNDLELMCTTIQTSTAQGTITTPAGWTSVASTGSVNGGGVFNNTYLFYKVAGGSEPSTYTVSYNTGGTSPSMDGNIRDYTGTATSSPINSFATVVVSVAATTVVIPALTETFASGEWYMACATDWGNGTATAVPTLSHTFFNVGADVSYSIGDLIPASAPGSETFTYSSSVAGRTGIGVSIKPLGGAAAPTHQMLLQGVGN